jgi:hypothetical protein
MRVGEEAGFSATQRTMKLSAAPVEMTVFGVGEEASKDEMTDFFRTIDGGDVADEAGWVA